MLVLGMEEKGERLRARLRGAYFLYRLKRGMIWSILLFLGGLGPDMVEYGSRGLVLTPDVKHSLIRCQSIISYHPMSLVHRKPLHTAYFVSSSQTERYQVPRHPLRFDLGDRGPRVMVLKWFVSVSTVDNRLYVGLGHGEGGGTA